MDRDKDRSVKDFLSVLGYLFLQNGKFARARKILLALHALHPDDPEVTRALMYGSFMAGFPAEALPLAEAYLAAPGLSERDRALGTLLSGRILWALDRKEEARNLLKNFSLPSP